MKKQNVDDEGYYSVSAFIAVALSILIHWLLLSKINVHPTLHAGIGIGIFFMILAAISSILRKFW
ncbi:hypothetical protein K9L16_03570 [Candidatus Pacearchaeota archaeon]|nr:hypothetical protein [Candidatus Pacearchaeota archaeon]